MILTNSNFYNDIQQLALVISSLEFEEAFYGHEVKNFNYLPESVETHIQMLTNLNMKISNSSGKFRKPYPGIHFENFDDKLKFVLAVALEETTFRTHQHESGIENVFNLQVGVDEFVQTELNPNKWTTTAEIKLKPNDFIVFNPWTWHSFDEKLIQVFYLEI